jgi:hypothetical protein
MPFISPPCPPQAAEIRPFWELEDSPIAQGLEGRQVREQIEIISKHWQEQSLDALVETDAELLDELNNYRHPPFENLGTIRVRFTKISDLEPRKFVFDEDDI